MCAAGVSRTCSMCGVMVRDGFLVEESLQNREEDASKYPPQSS
jgi:hypothetical protein